MTAKELAEAMLDGSLNYSPTDDASYIAKSYIALADLVEKTFEEYNSTGHLSTNLCLQAGGLLSHDPAKL